MLFRELLHSSSSSEDPYCFHKSVEGYSMHCSRVGVWIPIHSLMAVIRITSESFREGMEVYSNASPKGRDEDFLSFLTGRADDKYSFGSVEVLTMGNGWDPH